VSQGTVELTVGAALAARVRQDPDGRGAVLSGRVDRGGPPSSPAHQPRIGTGVARTPLPSFPARPRLFVVRLPHAGGILALDST
jgi:hypothetical protein